MRSFLTSLFALLGFAGAHAAEFPANIGGNQKTIRALIDAGSNPKKLHPLEHHFYCFSADSLKSLTSKGESLGYRIANIGNNTHEGKQYWFADLIMERPLDPKAINKENSLMLQLAHEFGADYDGWGATVVD